MVNPLHLKAWRMGCKFLSLDNETHTHADVKERLGYDSRWDMTSECLLELGTFWKSGDVTLEAWVLFSSPRGNCRMLCLSSPKWRRRSAFGQSGDLCHRLITMCPVCMRFFVVGVVSVILLTKVQGGQQQQQQNRIPATVMSFTSHLDTFTNNSNPTLFNKSCIEMVAVYHTYFHRVVGLPRVVADLCRILWIAWPIISSMLRASKGRVGTGVWWKRLCVWFRWFPMAWYFLEKQLLYLVGADGMFSNVYVIFFWGRDTSSDFANHLVLEEDVLC